MNTEQKNGIRGVIDAMEKEIAAQEKKAIAEAKDFSRRKKEEMRKKAMKDNEELFEMERKNIVLEMRREEEKIREGHKLRIVQAKKSFVDEIWVSVRMKFLSMPKRKREYGQFLRKVLASVKDKDRYIVFMRKEDSSRYKGAKARRMAGGALFRSKDGKIEIDYSLEGIAEKYREETKARISEVLFQ